MVLEHPPRKPAMSQEEAHAYLDARKEWAVLTTIGADGYPHSVLLGYFRLGDDLYLGMREGTQKVKNAERHPKACVVVADSRPSGGVTGVMVQGDASLVRDEAERLRLAREAARQRGVPEADWPSRAAPGGVYLRLRAKRYLSWRY
jgi:nitroimidazol reductase NimA-like FMN-containing flavoprotein (pyridoxamine 5'-phosphate oxidase superfamily)